MRFNEIRVKRLVIENSVGVAVGQITVDSSGPVIEISNNEGSSVSIKSNRIAGKSSRGARFSIGFHEWGNSSAEATLSLHGKRLEPNDRKPLVALSQFRGDESTMYVSSDEMIRVRDFDYGRSDIAAIDNLETQIREVRERLTQLEYEYDALKRKHHDAAKK